VQPDAKNEQPPTGRKGRRLSGRGKRWNALDQVVGEKEKIAKERIKRPKSSMEREGRDFRVGNSGDFAMHRAPRQSRKKVGGVQKNG